MRALYETVRGAFCFVSQRYFGVFKSREMIRVSLDVHTSFIKTDKRIVISINGDSGTANKNEDCETHTTAKKRDCETRVLI